MAARGERLERDTAYRYFQGEDGELYIMERALLRAGTTVKVRPAQPLGTQSSTARPQDGPPGGSSRRVRPTRTTATPTPTNPSTGPTQPVQQAGPGGGPDNDAGANSTPIMADAINGVTRNPRSRFRPIRVGDEVHFRRQPTRAERAAGTVGNIDVTQVPAAEGVSFQVTDIDDPILRTPTTFLCTAVAQFLVIDVNPVTGIPEGSQYYYIDPRNLVFTDIPSWYSLVVPDTTGPQQESRTTQQLPPPSLQEPTPTEQTPPPRNPNATVQLPRTRPRKETTPLRSLQHQVGSEHDPVTRANGQSGSTPVRDPVDGTRVLWRGPDGQVKPTATSTRGVSLVERGKRNWERPPDFPTSGNTLVKFYCTRQGNSGTNITRYVDERNLVYTDIPEPGMTIYEQLPLGNDGSFKNPVTRKREGGWTPVLENGRVFFTAPDSTQPLSTAPWDVGVSFTEHTYEPGTPPLALPFWAYNLSGDLQTYSVDLQSRVVVDSRTPTSVQHQTAGLPDPPRSQQSPESDDIYNATPLGSPSNARPQQPLPPSPSRPEDPNSAPLPVDGAPPTLSGPITNDPRFIPPSAGLAWEDLRAIVRSSRDRRRAAPERETGKNKLAGYGFAGIAKSSNDYYHVLESARRRSSRRTTQRNASQTMSGSPA